jgi:hypothetical protein
VTCSIQSVTGAPLIEEIAGSPFRSLLRLTVCLEDLLPTASNELKCSRAAVVLSQEHRFASSTTPYRNVLDGEYKRLKCFINPVDTFHGPTSAPPVAALPDLKDVLTQRVSINTRMSPGPSGRTAPSRNAAGITQHLFSSKQRSGRACQIISRHSCECPLLEVVKQLGGVCLFAVSACETN